MLNSLLNDVLDPTTLSQLVGQEAKAENLRIKPGTSLVVGTGDSWLRILKGEAGLKAAKAEKRAARHNLRVRTTTEGDLTIQSGEISLDPRLHGTFTKPNLVPTVQQAHVLRYNPMRRLVIHAGDVSVRFYPQASERKHRFFSSLPTPTEVECHADPRILAFKFVGDGDLAMHPSVTGYMKAGQYFAQLHQLPVSQDLPESNRNLARTMRAHQRVLSALSASLGDRLEKTRLPDVDKQPPTMVQGDASADQLLVDARSHQMWMTDFDRAGVGDPGVDLGNFLAVELATNSSLMHPYAFLQGYKSGGGQVPANLADYVMEALLHDLTLPLRRARPTWEDDIHARLDLVEQLRREGLPL